MDLQRRFKFVAVKITRRRTAYKCVTCRAITDDPLAHAEWHAVEGHIEFHTHVAGELSSSIFTALLTFSERLNYWRSEWLA